MTQKKNEAPVGSNGSARYCGRDFTAYEMALIEEIVNTKDLNRASMSRRVCRELNWLKADGKLKDMSCRVAMLRMEKDGRFSLPPPTKGNGNRTKHRDSNLMGNSHAPVLVPAGATGG